MPAATGPSTPTQGTPTQVGGAAGSGGSTTGPGQASGQQRPPPLANPPTTPALPSLSDPSPPDVLRPGDPSVKLARKSLDERRSLGSNLADRWELDDEYDRGRFLLRPYKPMYVLFGDWTTRINQRPSSPNPLNTATTSQQLTSTEAKFQISLKTKVLKNMIAGNGDLWLAYTQQSFWQIYNPEKSRPFRETNYEPEIMTVFRTNYSVLGWQGRMIGLALNHQSNGYDEPLSRNWNRVIAQFGFERRNWSLMIRPWWRIPETGGTDDNPDITDYAGRMDVLLVRQSGGHEWSLLARHSLRGGSRSHGGVQLGYAWPISSYLKGYAQIFSGYGSSLLDYNHRQTRIGIGISLVQWL
jgi:phospholipase A1